MFLLIKVFLWFVVLWFFVLAPFGAVYQEYKLWTKPPLTPMSPWGIIKMYWFSVTWFVLSQLCVFTLLPKILRRDHEGVEKDAMTFAERTTAFACALWFIGPVIIRGEENLPPPNDDHPEGTKACIYIANHASQADVAAVYFLRRRFKWIAKRSVAILPGVGQVMMLGNHIMLNRTKGTNKMNVKSMYEQSKATVQGGYSMFVFPQGTRCMHKRLPFKDGAFNIALENEVPLVPISLEIPPLAWNGLFPLNQLWGGKGEPIILTVHKPIQVTKDMDKTKLKEEAYDVIYSVLPDVVGEEEKKGK